MDELDYYYIYICLVALVNRRKLTRNVANKILRNYEQEYELRSKKRISWRLKNVLPKIDVFGLDM